MITANLTSHPREGLLGLLFKGNYVHIAKVTQNTLTELSDHFEFVLRMRFSVLNVYFISMLDVNYKLSLFNLRVKILEKASWF